VNFSATVPSSMVFLPLCCMSVPASTQQIHRFTL
jgi:hypothetical protein